MGIRMSEWQDFLKRLRGVEPEIQPGLVMISFVNRFLEPLDDVRYRIEFDKKTVAGLTTKTQHTVEIQPLSTQAIKVYAWSRVRQEFKLIDEVTPVLGQCKLVTERMKTYKHDSKTLPHPQPQPLKKPTPSPERPPAKSGPIAAPKPPVTPPGQPQGVQPVKAENKAAEPEHQTNRQVEDKIQVDQLKKIFPAASEEYLEKVAAELNTDLAKYKLDTPLRRAHFFAQVRQEAGSQLSPKQENLNYRPGVLIDKFDYYKTRHTEATADGRLEEEKEVERTVKGKKKTVKIKVITHPANQETIANKAYGERGNNGPIGNGNGWKFRGRGIFQLTFCNNYTSFNAEYASYWSDGSVDFVASPDKVCEFPYFIRSAVWYWIKNRAYIKADLGATHAAVNAITLIINGRGMDAAAKRRENFDELTYPAFK